MKFLAPALLALATTVSSASALADCPAPGDLENYVTTKLRRGAAGQEGEIRVYYRLLKAFDAAKPTLLIINGGPGGDHSLVHYFGPLADEMNVVGFDHRGLGCTKVLSRHDGDFENGLLTMGRAADDLDALREHLVGKGGQWFVYGVSYGGMLAQKYAIKYPAHIKGLILDSTFHRSGAIDVARKQYFNFYIEKDPAVHALYDEIVAKYPDARNHLLRRIWGLTYSHQGRTVEIKQHFESVLAAPDATTAKALYESEINDGPWSGMSADIICREIWDFGTDAALNDYYFADFPVQCPKYAKFREPMDWAEDLKKLPMKTLIWAGTYDPVTPAAVMHEMHALIPGSLLWENPHAGHGLYFEKQDCALKMMRLLFAGGGDDALKSVASDAACQSAPTYETEGRFDWKRVSGSRTATF